MNSSVYSCLVALYIVAVTVFLLLRTKQKNECSLIAKTFASIIFVVLAAVSVLSATYVIVKMLFVLGLVFGLVGDIFLDLKVMHQEKEKTYLNFGMLAFGAGHVLYFIGLMCYTTDKVLTGYGWVILAAFVFSLLVGALIVRFAPSLKMDFSGFKVQNWLYSSVLIFMTIVSLSLALVHPYAWILTVGFVLFLSSDLVLSMQYFGGKQDSNKLTVINHVLYYLAQLLIATFVFFA